MRKIIAIILAVVMLAAMSIPAFAKTLADESNSDKSDTVPVTYTSAQGYEVTIPDSFELNDLGTGADEKVDGYATGSGEVVATKAKINIGKKLVVTVVSSNKGADGMNWNLVEDGGSVKIGYTITVAGNITEATALGQGETVLSYTSSSEQWENQTSTMTLKTAYTNQAGTFKDTLTFTASVVNVVNA